MPLDAGSRLGLYEIVAPLGAGGMGEVFRATDTRLHRALAIKILPHDKVADPERKRRFLPEARAASALNHPNIVTLQADPALQRDPASNRRVGGTATAGSLPRC